MATDDDTKKALFEKLGLITGADYAKKRSEKPEPPSPLPQHAANTHGQHAGE
jgi:hypothetical protein